jgi:glycogen debranching enzyme
VPHGPSSDIAQTALARRILADGNLDLVHRMAQNLLEEGLNAGTNYKSVWIRDTNTFIEVALEVNPPERFRQALLMFCKFQGDDGNIPDGYVPRALAKITKTDRTTPLASGFVAFKNTVESDQESSLVQAVFKYIAVTHDRTILDEIIGEISVRDRLGRAMQYLLSKRFDTQHGLVWGATRADWGDVQPEDAPGVLLDDKSHRALCIYDNAMLVIALNDYLQLIGEHTQQGRDWTAIRDHLAHNIRQYLWDAKNQKFIPHIYLDGSPFPKSFDENAIDYHGGTAVAIEAGLLSREETGSVLARMEQDVRATHAGTIGLTIYPPYPRRFFKNGMRVPYYYQNGGDWTWFGGRMIQQLVKERYPAEAYRNLLPMLERVQRNQDFNEWWSLDNQERGSKNFRGSAGVLGKAIEMLQAWAHQHVENK